MRFPQLIASDGPDPTQLVTPSRQGLHVLVAVYIYVSILNAC